MLLGSFVQLTGYLPRPFVDFILRADDLADLSGALVKYESRRMAAEFVEQFASPYDNPAARDDLDAAARAIADAESAARLEVLSVLKRRIGAYNRLHPSE